MPITNPNAVVQALANIKLESLSLSKEIKELLDKALLDDSIDTTYLLNLLRG
ncbi:hypothetical protein [Vibrio coralliirubri]|uniref:hypothetical protein n=1 Tax=Vibrio coralliirubri TaxID=1516159 RepID=UPI000639218F|nr:hypothetical protein [Vibrio coralliirubri]CDT07753.1 hypothetical protein VCR1J2_200028 [Vibrio coralliirubri]CDT78345.1 hypothetical protein VCR8J2_190716 [Vibrio coralliirubri]